MAKDMAPMLKAVAVVVREYVTLAMTDFGARLKAIEERPVTSPAEAELRGMLGEMHSRVFVLETRPLVPGPPGTQGLQGIQGIVGPEGPEGKSGADGQGKEGVPGLPGLQGIEGKTGQDGAPGLQGPPGESIAGPKGDTGATGATGDRGPEGPPGPARDGRDGQPGIGTQGAKGLDGTDGTNGKDGADGLGFDDLVVLPDGERSVTFRFVKGDRVKDYTVTFPVDIYRGVYAEGKTYERGDGVTWGGSEWHCNEPTTTKPGEGLKSWTLKVKRGRDGKDGRDADGPPPVVKIR